MAAGLVGGPGPPAAGVYRDDAVHVAVPAPGAVEAVQPRVPVGRGGRVQGARLPRDHARADVLERAAHARDLPQAPGQDLVAPHVGQLGEVGGVAQDVADRAEDDAVDLLGGVLEPRVPPVPERRRRGRRRGRHDRRREGPGGRGRREALRRGRAGQRVARG
eukprot:CAMPEP_0179220924 /NCGR_PEP_ID=MMETSP0797-20121207/5898_1 /TAXON_ID=47934 /ORGANISM="Dinophysis acuminata, Strain DAEP01" /LENGTH=161 /DNA_ID=CAMNT_0020927635 /DNA_START=288 /DNA_END=769 /DNA_ORIENTATION=-